MSAFETMLFQIRGGGVLGFCVCSPLCSESEFLEEEISGGLSFAGTLRVGVSGLELSLHSLDHSLALGRVLESLLSDNTLEVELVLDNEASGEEMRVVHVLDERFDARSALNLLLGHLVGDVLGGSLDAGNESVAKLAALLAIVDLLHDNSLLASSPASEENDNASFLHTTEHKKDGHG